MSWVDTEGAGIESPGRRAILLDEALRRWAGNDRTRQRMELAAIYKSRGYSEREIADRMGTSRRTIRAYMRAVREAMTEVLGDFHAAG